MKSIKNKKYILVGLPLIILGGALVAIFVTSSNIQLNSNKSTDTVPESQAKTTSKAPSAQADFTDGDDRQPQQNHENEGIITDNGGALSEVPPSSEWTESSDGKILVYQPKSNGLLKSGDLLSGNSDYSNISFRLIDDVSGVIAQGNLKVIKGHYSGTFSFITSGQNGRLDIFSTDNNGLEVSNTEIPVRFR